MTYERPKFGDPSVKTVATHSAFFGSGDLVPDFERPISIKENYYRAARHENPMWVPMNCIET